MVKRPHNHKRDRRRSAPDRLAFEDLEPRVLLSADPLAVADSLDAQMQGQTAQAPAPWSP